MIQLLMSVSHEVTVSIIWLTAKPEKPTESLTITFSKDKKLRLVKQWLDTNNISHDLRLGVMIANTDRISYLNQS